MGYKESFLQYLKAEKRYSQNTVRSYNNDLNQFEVFLESLGLSSEPVSVTSHDIRAWVVSLLESNYNPVSVHRKITCLRVYYHYLIKEGVLKSDPLGEVVLPKRKKTLPAFVDEDAISKLLDEAYFSDDFEGVRDRDEEG
jgi:integrase/recombinase XerC